MKRRWDSVKKSLAMVSSMCLITLLCFMTNGLSAHAEDHSYDGKSPYYNNCASSGTTKATARLIDANNKQFGIVELKFSSVCKTAWAKITLDKAVPSGWEANAYVKRNTDGKELNCSSSGGNGKVLPGQTSCYTPMVYDLDPRSSYAMGRYYNPSTGALTYAYTSSY
ncbi:DUF2690 domain-containing protein [Bacillus swezeyi]|uniref:DUF2690 domain-containing protein n=1 Tax=Bacillus swezeyi TaxID=1925020 RepID=UPI003F8C937C